MALVALDLDGIKHVGSGFKRYPELALSGVRVDGRLRRWEPMRTGAQ